MKVKKLLCILSTALAVSLTACGLGGNDNTAVLNYEQPVSTMRGALTSGDELSYLCCFLPQEKARYMQSDGYSDDFIDSAIDKSSIISRVRIKITDSSELTDEELDGLENAAQETYSTRFEFSKGQRLDVNILVDTRQEQLCDSRELTVVRYENVWYIYGDVIDSFSFLPLSNTK